MPPSENDLPEYYSRQQLVGVRRDSIDDREIHGFILKFSDQILLLRYVTDFVLIVIFCSSEIRFRICDATNSNELAEMLKHHD